MRKYNSRTVYECLNNPFKSECVSPVLNMPPIIIDNIPHLDKRARYTPDLLPAAISVASEKSIITFTNPSDSPQHLVLTSDDTNHIRYIKKDEPYSGRVKI